MGICRRCGRRSILVSDAVGFCADCIREHPEDVLSSIAERRGELRRQFGLPPTPPKAENGVACHLCANRCVIPEGGVGFCGGYENRGGRLRPKTGSSGIAAVSFYHDALPTNCVADWVCPGGTGAGYPRFAYRNGPEFGYKNLAVFYQRCNFDCLFCQNWHFRDEGTHRYYGVEEVAAAVDERTACICFFGGDPTPTLAHSLAVAQAALEKRPHILRICWETNGAMNRNALKKALRVALETGGCVKFDLKFHSDSLNQALCGASNRQTLANFRFAVEFARRSGRSEPPLVVASTLLVPGYTDTAELQALAAFIAECDPQTPWALLAFHPDFVMRDLPTTSRNHAETAVQIARRFGISRVRVGNLHLLGDTYRI